MTDLPTDEAARQVCIVLHAPKIEMLVLDIVHAYLTATDEGRALVQNKARYTWLADKVLACDYGDNPSGKVGWIIRHCKGPTWIAGPSIDMAIDAVIAAQEKP